MTDLPFDSFRHGYEITRLHLAPSWYSDEGMRESYDRGVAFTE